MLSKQIVPYLLVLLGAILCLSLIILSIEDNLSVPIRFFGNTLQIDLTVLTVSSLLSGGMFGFCLRLAWSVQKITSANQTKWQVQDAKLIAEVKSDREKQLEAKIQTLEAALKQSLKKNQI